MITFQVHAEQGFNQQPIHPAGGTGIPGPTAASDVRRDGIDIGGDDVRFDFISGNLGGRRAVMNGIEQREEFPRAVVVAHERKGHGGPERAVGVLAAVLAHAGNVTFDVSRIER